jgi:hypothetical protein
MSQEPPRVNFSGAGFQSPGQLPGRRPQGNAGRVVAIVLGTLFLLMFLCAGVAGVAYRRFNADSNFGGNLKELREPVGGAIPGHIRDVVQRSDATETDETEGVAEWLENGVLEVDTARLVMEMQRSGLSGGLVNPLTRVMWTLNLENELEPVELGNRVAVLDFEWLVKDKEARVVVSSFSTYGDENYVHVLYINRQDDQWKLFDWRDVLLPMSEAQFWAIYAGLDEPQDQAYYEFTDDFYKTFADESLAQPEKIKRTMSTFKRTKFPHQYTAMAQNFLCSWLVVYNAKEELAEVVKQLSPDEFAGAWLYKAQSAAWSNEPELAFRCLTTLNKQVGWHPKAAQMAAKLARTPEQKHLAAEWLQRSVLLAPFNSSSSNNYFKLADRQQMETLFQEIAKTKRPTAQVIELVEPLGYLNERHIRLLADLTQPIAELQEARQYLDFRMAVAKEDFAEVLKLAPAIMQLKSLSDDQNSANNYSLYSHYLTAAAKSNSLTHAAEQATDRDEFLKQLRDRAIYGDFDLPPKETASILKSIPDGHELRDDKRTPIAIAKMDVKQGNASEAFDSLLAMYKENDSEITADEPSEFVYPLLHALGPTALASERWRELVDVVDPEVLLLILAWSDEIKPDQMQQVLDWYETVPNQAALWPKYFRARLAFESGDWPAADRLIVEAIRLAKQDLRVTGDTLPPLVAMMANSDEYEDYESDVVSSWKRVRMTYAVRCNVMDRLVADAQISDELDADWVTWIKRYYSMASIESREKIASMLKASPLSEAQELGEEIRASLLIDHGQFAEAFDKAVKRAQGMERDSYEQRFAVKSAGSQLLKSGDKRRIEPLRQVSRGTDVEAYVDCVAATLEGDVPALCHAIERWDSSGPSGPYQKFVDVDVLKRLQGIPNLRDVTVVQPIDIASLRYSCHESLLVLAADAAQATITFEDFLKSKAISYTALESSRFDQATAAFEIKTGNGEFVVTFRSASAEAFEKNALTDTFAKDARTFAICVRKNTDMQESSSSEFALRTTINDLLVGLPSAVALSDVGSTSVFYGAGWQQRFGQSLKTGIDVAHPKEFYDSLAVDKSKWFIERNGQSFVVFSQARELVPIKLQPQASPWLDEVGVALAPSILIPCLTADMMVETDR